MINRLMERRRLLAICMAIVAMLVLAACGADATATTTPTDVPQPTQLPTTPTDGPSPTQAPASTPEPSATSTPEPPESTPVPPVLTDYSSITGELSKLIQSVVDSNGITGLSVALVDDQEMVWAEGFGFADKENGVRATPETVYGVASISKLFTATAIMQLAEIGKLDIDQPLQTYIPKFSINSRFTGSSPITPRNVMTHHSGLPSDLLNGLVATGDNEASLIESAFDELVQQIDTAYVGNPPDTPFSYSNLGYGLLGHAVAQSSGQNLIEYVDEAVLRPLGMKSSSLTITPEIEQLRSKEY